MENKRKTITLGGKIEKSNIQQNIESFKQNKVSNPNPIIKNNDNRNNDNRNIKDFLKSNSSFDNLNVGRDRQIKNLNNRNTFAKNKENVENIKKAEETEKTETNIEELNKNVIENSNVDDKVEKINEKKVEDSKNINTYKILSDLVRKQKEAERIKKEEERAKRDLENKKKQEEELRKFNAKGKNNRESEENTEKNFVDRENVKNYDKKNSSDVKKEVEKPISTESSTNEKNVYKKDSYKKGYGKNFLDEEEENNTKLKKNIVNNVYSKNKNIHTYIASDEDDDDSGFHKKRKRGKGFFKNKSNNKEAEHFKIIQNIDLPEFITVVSLAEKMNEKKADVVKKLISMGMPVTVNQTLDADTAELIAVEFGHTINKRITEHDVENKLDENQEGTKFISRAPIVTIMGHVDHGKTSLLDSIRTTHIAEGESGGITQHIGASRVEVGEGKFITFIDTPGHEAFTEMRMRGASITDIVVLVVAADDGVKDQTIEAINHAKAAKVPIILAINKIDKIGANPNKVQEELLQYDIITEKFGGEIMAVEVSAKEKIGLDKLRETILLQAEIMVLKAPIDVKPTGAVIEARMDQTKGPIASLLVQKGILKLGDLVLVGTSFGRIKKMTDDKHKIQKEALPSMAVEILGLNSVPTAGDQFNVLDEEKQIREIIAYRERKLLEQKVAKRSVRSLDSMLKTVGGKSAKLLPVIIKADVNGSIEAIMGTLNKLNTSEVEMDIVHCATGAINESDITLASVSNAIILGFNVRANSNAVEMAKLKDVDIRYYSIIYNIVDDIKNILSGMLEPIQKEEITGHAEVRQVFKVTGSGKIAGSIVIDGELLRNNNIRVIRDGIVIYSGTLKALKRFKDDVKEVKNGYECGISVENFEDIKEKDILEGFKITEEKREL